MMIWRLILPFLILPLAAVADDGLPAVVRDEAWFTGSLASTGANALPAGHFLAEPYVGETIPSHTGQSLNLLLYGVTDEFTVGLIPRFSWHNRAEVGDVSARLQYRFSAYDEDTGRPALAFVVNQDLPTGKYDHLDRAGDDGAGSGAFVTRLGLLADDYVTIDGRPLRLRLNLSYGISTSVGLEDRSVYGTPDGFRGSARPGAAYDAVLAFEYSLSTRWAVALDATYDRTGKTRVGDTILAEGQSAALVPALEYNFTAFTGLIVGVQLPVWQSATPRVTVPLAALNCVF